MEKINAIEIIIGNILLITFTIIGILAFKKANKLYETQKKEEIEKIKIEKDNRLLEGIIKKQTIKKQDIEIKKMTQDIEK